MMRWRISVVSALALMMPAVTAAQTGLTYHFKADSLSGRVWVLGDNARRELESGERGAAAGRIEIWKDGGKQVFILNPRDRTYYDAAARGGRQGLSPATVETLTVRAPFRVDSVDGVQVDLRTLARSETISGYDCQRSILTFSYQLKVAVANESATMPARVDGTQDVCLLDAPGAPRLPFGHQTGLTSGHPAVDAAIAERLTPLGGVPVAGVLNVSRRIQNGETVSATTAFILSDIQEATIAADRFQVPKGYRYQEPEITPPARKRQ